ALARKPIKLEELKYCVRVAASVFLQDKRGVGFLTIHTPTLLVMLSVIKCLLVQSFR
uniref:FERM domain-containing protein n=1 Tax=Mesocestoides corti TaxID=53468 RepID=A0A5K3ET36_MESCO